MRDIQEAINETTHSDIIIAYENLLSGSENHLRAFVNQIELLGVEYLAQVLDQSEVDAILGNTSAGEFRINSGSRYILTFTDFCVHISVMKSPYGG